MSWDDECRWLWDVTARYCSYGNDWFYDGPDGYVVDCSDAVLLRHARADIQALIETGWKYRHQKEKAEEKLAAHSGAAANSYRYIRGRYHTLLAEALKHVRGDDVLVGQIEMALESLGNSEAPPNSAD